MTPLLAALAILLVAWFAAGSVVNVRRGSAALRWLQGGLPRLGARTTVRWLGTSAVQLVLSDPRPPFREVTLIVFLEPRDLPWMWALGRAGGRRDTLILRATLRDPPRAELEVVDPASWSGREILRRLPPAEWGVREPAGGSLVIVCRSRAALPRAAELLAAARQAGAPVRRLSVRPGAPHLQLHLALPGAGVAPGELFEAVRALGELASHDRPSRP